MIGHSPIVSSKVAARRAAAVALLLALVCSAGASASGVSASEQAPADASIPRELASDASAFTVLATPSTPVTISIVSPETLASGINSFTAASEPPAVPAFSISSLTAASESPEAPVDLAPAPSSGKLTPSPFIMRQNAAATATPTSTPTSTPTPTTSSPGTEFAGSGSGPSPSRVNSLKTPTKKPTKAPAHRSGSGSGTGVSTGSDDDYDGYETGSGSNTTYACACSELRKVSLMGQANYCLPRKASLSNKCGNRVMGENGECPRKGAMPCSDTGFVLTKDAKCLPDDNDNGIFKCVMSAEDLEIKKNGGKRKSKKNSTASANANGGGDAGDARSAAAGLHRASPALHVVTFAVSVALGVAALL